MQAPQRDWPSLRRSAQPSQRGSSSTKRRRHGAQTRSLPQSWQMAHWVGGRRRSSREVNHTGSIYCRPMPEPQATRQLDANAVHAALRRLARAPSAPWLHAEVARRMAERLALIRLQPERIVDWWSFLGASGDWLDQTY